MNSRLHSRSLFLSLPVLLLTFGLTMISSVMAQQPANNETSLVVTDSGSSPANPLETRITSRFVGGTVYLNWYMKGDKGNSVFIVERSVNGSEFAPIGFKDGFAAPDKNTEILYCFKDTTPENGICTYRIKQFINSGFLYGRETCVNVDNSFALINNTD